MLTYFTEQKKKIETFLIHYIKGACSELAIHGHDVLDIPGKLINFVCKGKMIRGGLIALSYSLYTDPLKGNSRHTGLPGEIAKAGAVLELFQSGLLVHDDIMDRDETRRGEDALFFQYVKRAKAHNIKDPYHIGEALGICAGDLFLFMAFHLLHELQLDRKNHLHILSLCSTEMCRVTTAQMYDVFWGADSHIPSASEIIELYRNKTGRYTFSLPLKIGAILAGAGKKECEALEKIGELLGVVFQMRDDDINLYGSEEETGKPVGSDIKEGKKTLSMSLVFEKADKNEKARLLSLIGNPNISEKEIHYLKMLIDELGVRPEIDNMIKDLNDQATGILTSMNPPNKAALKTFMEVLEYNQQRKR